MDCKVAQEKLPAYLEGDLSPTEKALVTEHLVVCPGCRRALEDLRKSGALVQGIEEAEPPAWLKQRVMARVREEAGKKVSEEAGRAEGFFRRLFYPLHIKVPAGVLATALIAVVAVQVFKSVEPQVEYPAQAPAGVAREALPQEEKAPPPPVHAPREKRAPGVVERDSARDTRGAAALSREREVIGPAVSGPMTETKKEMPVEKPDAPAKAKDRAKIPEPYAAGRASSRAVEESTAVGAADRLAYEKAPALAASQVKKASPADTGELVFTLRAYDAARAAGEVESLLDRLGAKKVERKARGKDWSVSAELEASKIPEFLEKLKSAGQVGGAAPAAVDRRGSVPVRVEIPHLP